MTTSLDQRPHAAAVIAALQVAGGDTPAFEYDNVPGSKHAAKESVRKASAPPIYWVVALERRANLQVRGNARTGRTGWRISVTSVGRTVAEARWAMAQAAVALNEARLYVGVDEAEPPATSTRIQFERDQAPEPDDGLFSGLSSWTYAL